MPHRCVRDLEDDGREDIADGEFEEPSLLGDPLSCWSDPPFLWKVAILEKRKARYMPGQRSLNHKLRLTLELDMAIRQTGNKGGPSVPTAW